MSGPRPTSILHRTPWTPPIAIATDGVYIDLEDGRRVIDGIGGAAVTCIGGKHPKVVKALKDQIDVMSCNMILSSLHRSPTDLAIDVYNMQLSSPPAEELAKFLVDTSDGAFEQVAFLSGGMVMRVLHGSY